MGKKIFILIFTCIFVLISCFLSSFAEEKVIKIGGVFSLTGEAVAGYYDKIGIDLAIDEINAAGGINGIPVEMVYEDSRSETSGAVSALKLLLEKENIAGLLSSQYSTMCFAIDSIIREAGLVSIVGGSNNKLTHMGNKWLFRNRPNDGLMAATMVRYAVDSLGAKRILLFHNSDEFGTGGATIAEETLKELGTELLLNLSYNSGDKDFTGQLMKSKGKNVDTILWWGHGIEAGLVAKQVKQLGLKVNIVGSNSWAQEASLMLAGDAALGTYAVTDCIPLESRMNDPRIAELVEKYKAKNNGILSEYGIAAYDAAYLMVEAIRRAGSTDHEKIREALHTIKDFEGALTTYTVDENGDAAHSGVVLVVQKGGKLGVKKVVYEPGFGKNE